jgi:hypothetical protein
MSYSSGGLIQATDYNGFVGTSPGNTSNTLNAMWAVGNGQYGYGQTALGQVSSTGLVTATQWATAVNTLNSISTHQTGSGTGISAPTSGSLASYLSTFSSSLATAYSGHLSFNSQGSTTTGTTYSPNFTYTNSGSAETMTITRTVTFASADQARYFFNAGGQINFVVASVTVGDGTARSTDLQTLLVTDFASLTAFRSTTNGGRSGSGGTLNTGATTIGYWGLTTSAQTLTKITSTTSGYTSDYITLTAQTNGVQGSNADNGTVITFVLTIYSAARTDSVLSTFFNDTINVTVNHHVDVVSPETTNLSNSWGTVTIA